MLSRSRLVAVLLTGAAFAAGLGAAVASAGTSAAAASPTDYVTPGAGNPGTQLTVNTNGLCPSGNTNFDVSVSGAGITTHPLINGNSTLPAAGPNGYAAAVTETMSQFASEQSPAATLSGAYTFDFDCFASSISLSPDETFVGTLSFEGSGNGSTNTYTNTVTRLAALPSTSAHLGSKVTITATLSPPNAAGQVQFMDGSTKLGAPVTVSSGSAVYKTSSLALGSHSLTATFAPLPTDKTGTWGTSMSAVLKYTINTPPPVFVPMVYGTVKVGSTVTCIQGVNYATTTTWSWYRNGILIKGATASSYKIPSSLLGKDLTCKLSASDGQGTTTEMSAAVKVGAA